jgi:hypothetical protein
LRSASQATAFRKRVWVAGRYFQFGSMRRRKFLLVRRLQNLAASPSQANILKMKKFAVVDPYPTGNVNVPEAITMLRLQHLRFDSIDDRAARRVQYF